jgi:putative membrane protein
MRLQLFFAATSAATLFAAAVSAQPASQSMPMRDAGDAMAKPVGMASASTLGSMKASAFVENAARSDMYEIKAAKLAEVKSSDPAIEKFAHAMIPAHTETTLGLKAALRRSGLHISPPTMLDARRQGMLDNLKASSGAEFDKRYVAQQVAAHEEALALMQGYAAHGDNAALQAAAAKTAPLVQSHLDMAKQLPGV